MTYITFVKMLDEHVRFTMVLKAFTVPDLSRDLPPGHLLKDFVPLSRLYPLRR